MGVWGWGGVWITQSDTFMIFGYCSRIKVPGETENNHTAQPLPLTPTPTSQCHYHWLEKLFSKRNCDELLSGKNELVARHQVEGPQPGMGSAEGE